MFTITWTFLRFGIFPSLKIMNPKINPKNIINAYLFGLRLILYFLHFWKQNLSHQMIIHIIIDYEVIFKNLHELV
jgi:hypothetical protein